MTITEKKKKKKQVTLGIANIQTTFNNTIVTFADSQGNVLCSASSGECGFKGKRKATPYAAQITVQKAAESAKEKYGIQTVTIRIKGAGPQRELAIRSVFDQGLLVSQIQDVSPLAHNGPRPPKRRRV